MHGKHLHIQRGVRSHKHEHIKRTGIPHRHPGLCTTVKVGRLERKLRNKTGQWRNLEKRGPKADWRGLMQGATVPVTKCPHSTAAPAGGVAPENGRISELLHNWGVERVSKVLG